MRELMNKAGEIGQDNLIAGVFPLRKSPESRSPPDRASFCAERCWRNRTAGALF